MYSAKCHRATSQKPENSFTVDLDAEKGRTPRTDGKPERDNEHRVVIRFAKKVQLATVRGYLEGKIDFDNGILEGISKTSLTSQCKRTADSAQTSWTTCSVRHHRSR